MTPAFILQDTVLAESVSEFSPEKAGFTVKFKNELSSYKVIGVFVLPEETLEIEATDAGKDNYYTLRYSAGNAIPLGTNQWRWQPPKEPGLYPVRVANTESADSITLNVFVMVPYGRVKGGSLNGYEIGKYPPTSLRGLPVYMPPLGFIEVTGENEETLVAPHFKLKQFLCKQEYGYPKYVVLKERLLLKLELILEQVNTEGYNAKTFNVMSGYRTPRYNGSIYGGRHSRHIYGDAADIFIDEDGDNMMDDLNRDGKADPLDARVLYDIIDSMYGKPWYEHFVGGLSSYKGKRDHGPFVHTDVRGFWVRW